MKFLCIQKCLLLLAVFLPFTVVNANQVRVAVASNFLSAAKNVAERFYQESGHSVIISAGSTGKIYAQIINGAPFDIFLAANSREPQRLEEDGFTVVGSRFTYTKGKLVLLSFHSDVPLSIQDLQRTTRVGLANPKLAPYGYAAQQVMEKYAITSSVKRIYAENVSQVFLHVITGNVPMGFVAFSQVVARFGDKLPAGMLTPDSSIYSPIEQQAVLLKRAKDSVAARAFMDYLKSAAIQKQIVLYGYAQP